MWGPFFRPRRGGACGLRVVIVGGRPLGGVFWGVGLRGGCVYRVWGFMPACLARSSSVVRVPVSFWSRWRTSFISVWFS